ncbi:MAG: undecaprenyl-diphosphatase UppP [Chloroflexi bacterium HGW-Chloroflexi-10]|nr:MAG: undecaprenyl-diphosphatase UppP [Chloroflexi bacterium HGW-Chloroflexi-10]
MTIWQAIILGIIQGLTEFLPVSSSGHLVIAPYLFGWQIPESQIFPFDVLVQWGTLLAVIIYFRKDLWGIVRDFLVGIFQKKPFGSTNARMGWYLVIATIPAVVIGFLFKDAIEQVFHSVLATALFLLVTAGLLIISEKIQKTSKDLSKMNWVDALVIGFCQVLSILPGVSRSGSTIAGGLFRNIHRTEAARFSFLMSIPVMLGAGLLSLDDLFEIPNLLSFAPSMVVGFISAAIVGFLSIHWLLKFLNKNKLIYFAYYCIILSVLTVIIFLVR